MNALSDILIGALTPGVNAPTFIALQAVCVAALLSLVALLVYSYQRAPELVVHVWVLVGLAVGLIIRCGWDVTCGCNAQPLSRLALTPNAAAPSICRSVNWLISNVGLTSAEEQRKDLGLDGADEPAGEPVRAEPQTPDKKED